MLTTNFNHKKKFTIAYSVGIHDIDDGSKLSGIFAFRDVRNASNLNSLRETLHSKRI